MIYQQKIYLCYNYLNKIFPPNYCYPYICNVFYSSASIHHQRHQKTKDCEISVLKNLLSFCLYLLFSKDCESSYIQEFKKCITYWGEISKPL